MSRPPCRVAGLRRRRRLWRSVAAAASRSRKRWYVGFWSNRRPKQKPCALGGVRACCVCVGQGLQSVPGRGTKKKTWALGGALGYRLRRRTGKTSSSIERPKIASHVLSRHSLHTYGRPRPATREGVHACAPFNLFLSSLSPSPSPPPGSGFGKPVCYGEGEAARKGGGCARSGLGLSLSWVWLRSRWPPTRDCDILPCHAVAPALNWATR